MADEGVFTDQAGMLRKAGTNVSSLITAAVDTGFVFSNDFIAQAENTINVATRFNWSDAFSTLNIDVKSILTEVASNLAAIYAISFDMSGYTTRAEAETMLDVLRDGALRGISILKVILAQDFVNGET